MRTYVENVFEMKGIDQRAITNMPRERRPSGPAAAEKPSIGKRILIWADKLHWNPDWIIWTALDILVAKLTIYMRLNVETAIGAILMALLEGSVAQKRINAASNLHRFGVDDPGDRGELAKIRKELIAFRQIPPLKKEFRPVKTTNWIVESPNFVLPTTADIRLSCNRVILHYIDTMAKILVFRAEFS